MAHRLSQSVIADCPECGPCEVEFWAAFRGAAYPSEVSMIVRHKDGCHRNAVISFSAPEVAKLALVMSDAAEKMKGAVNA